MWDSKPQEIPMSTEVKLSTRDCPEEGERHEMANVPYRSVIGSLMYLMVSTRPDLASSLSILSRFLANPGKAHWEAAKRVPTLPAGNSKYGTKV